MKPFLLMLLTTTAAEADMTVIEDFSTPDGWAYISDRVMGGVSDGAATLTSEDGSSFAQLRGTVSTENGGGFIQIRRDINGLQADVNAITLRVRGNAERYFVHLRPKDARRPWDYYASSFTTTPAWQDIRLPLAEFEPSRDGRLAPLTPENIRSIGIVAYGANYKASLDVAKISAD